MYRAKLAIVALRRRDDQTKFFRSNCGFRQGPLTGSGNEVNNVRVAEDAAHGDLSVDARRTGIVALRANARVKAFAMAQLEGRAAD